MVYKLSVDEMSFDKMSWCPEKLLEPSSIISLDLLLEGFGKKS